MKNIRRILSFLLVLAVLSIGVLAQDAAQDATQDADDTMTGNELQVWIQDVVSNTDDYVGQTVSLRGVVGDLVNVRSFTLMEDAVLDADGVLVINNSGSPLDLNLGAEDRFLVTGVVHAPIDEVYGEDADFDFDREYYNDYRDDLRVEDENLALFEDAFTDYSSWPILEITNAGNIVPAVTLQELADGAEPYNDGRVYAIEGYVNEILNDNTFVLGEGANVANARVLVFAPATTEGDANFGVTEMGLDYDTIYDQDMFVRVYGTIAAVDEAATPDAFVVWDEDVILDADLDYNTLYEEEELLDYDIDAWEAVFSDLVIQVPER